VKAIEVKPGVLVIAGGKLGVVVRCAADAKVEVLLNGTKTTVKFDVYNIECIDPNYNPDQPLDTMDKLVRGNISEGELDIATFRFNTIKVILMVRLVGALRRRS